MTKYEKSLYEHRSGNDFWVRYGPLKMASSKGFYLIISQEPFK